MKKTLLEYKDDKEDRDGYRKKINHQKMKRKRMKITEERVYEEDYQRRG